MPHVALRTLNVFKYGKRALQLNILYTAAAFMNYRFPDFDIIHAHFGSRGNLVILLSELGLIKGKIVTTFYGKDVTKAPKNGGRDIYKNLFLKGDLFLVLSNTMREQIADLGCGIDKIKIHHLGIDLRRFRTISNHPVKDGAIMLLSVGRLVEKKGIEFAIRAVAALSKVYPRDSLSYNRRRTTQKSD
jgi:colanic acid/amylovoran biosynthesis glycosyltransferase